ncbi:MAG: hypothetical protein ACRDY1_04855, partial [Acidimicrobiales bacterium]
GGVGFLSNQSWYGLIHRPPFVPGALRIDAWGLAEIATIAIGLFGAKRLMEAKRTIDALLVLALTELLTSPISWTHHWSWLVILPIVLVGRRGQRRHVSDVVMIFVLVVAVARPYDWPLIGWQGALAKDSLCVAGGILLGTMAFEERTSSPWLGVLRNVFRRLAANH